MWIERPKIENEKSTREKICCIWSSSKFDFEEDSEEFDFDEFPVSFSDVSRDSSIFGTTNLIKVYLVWATWGTSGGVSQMNFSSPLHLAQCSFLKLRKSSPGFLRSSFVCLNIPEVETYRKAVGSVMHFDSASSFLVVLTTSYVQET